MSASDLPEGVSEEDVRLAMLGLHLAVETVNICSEFLRLPEGEDRIAEEMMEAHLESIASMPEPVVMAVIGQLATMINAAADPEMVQAWVNHSLAAAKDVFDG